MDSHEEHEPLPVLYSKSSIMIISIMTSTVFGAILYAINLYRIDRRKYIFPTVLGAIIYQLLGARFAGSISIDYEFLVYIGLNFIGGLLILGLWDLQIGKATLYQPRNTLSVFLVILIILLILMGLNYLGLAKLEA